MKYDLPEPNATHAVPHGLRVWRPVFDTLSVCQVGDCTVLTVQPAGGKAVLFELTPQDRAHLVALLLGEARDVQ